MAYHNPFITGKYDPLYNPSNKEFFMAEVSVQHPKKREHVLSYGADKIRQGFQKIIIWPFVHTFPYYILYIYAYELRTKFGTWRKDIPK